METTLVCIIFGCSPDVTQNNIYNNSTGISRGR